LKQYKRDRLIRVLESLGFKIINPNTDAVVYYLQHRESKNIIITVDKQPDKFPEDYIKGKIEQATLNFDVFNYLYDKSKTDKHQHIKRND